MRKIAWLMGVATLLVAGGYSIVSLNRWEFTRALYFGLVFLVAEIGLAAALILRRLGQMQTDAPARGDVDPEVLARLRETRPPSRDRFEWLNPVSGRTNVFITFLVGGGVVMSGLAWAVDKVAGRTTTPAGEERLAAQLGRIQYPSGGLLVDDVTVLAQAVPYCDDPQLRMLLRRAGHRG